jgi:hypothetical protein
MYVTGEHVAEEDCSLEIKRERERERERERGGTVPLMLPARAYPK